MISVMHFNYRLGGAMDKNHAMDLIWLYRNMLGYENLWILEG
jgi:hypothetical protein